jgi:hypothetical protein
VSRRVTAAGIALAASSLLACEGAPTAADAPRLQHRASAALDAERLRARVSVDLLGRRPAPETQGSTESYEAAVEAHLDDAAFARTVGDWYAAVFRTRIDRYRFFDERAQAPGHAPAELLHTAVGEEIPALVTWLVLNDRPFSELVRAPVTFVDPVLLEVWPLEPAEGDFGRTPPGAVPARYTDGRPAAGVLSTNAFMWRFTSTVENANRGRANALSRALLCEDFLDRPIDFPRDIDLSDSESIRDAVRTVPACLGCHATLDPLASHLWGFVHRQDEFEVWRTYHVAQEQDWRRETRRAPAFFGVPGESLGDLGARLGADPRFVNCTVEQVWRVLMGRTPRLADDADVATHREAFVRSGLRMRALVRSIVLGPAYRGAAGRGPFGRLAAPLDERLARPDQLASTLADLTGYRLTFDGRDALRVDEALRTVAGASDHGAASETSTGLALVHRRLAEGAARFVLDTPDPETPLGRLLNGVDRAAAPSAALVSALATTVLARDIAPESDAVAALSALYADALAVSHRPAEAWHALLTALLADPEVIFL